ncbi:uncharacterized protein TNIN_184851 [Trichonephila inaurata madagascariensis]|uniref:ATP-dependent DNA helicase n=1 Tax=Trichonephila inaurata madagascariensis TaxID=2747483 RepID=A0A8X6M709_9ARAC|nr:uncharacterized protein TNIN_184851 [Trichonephila inaurata madagascariensis]
MLPKRSAIGRSTNQAKRRREERASEASEQRKTRQERDRVHTALARSLETSEQRQARQQRNRIHRTQTRRMIHTDLNLCGFNYNPLYNYSLHPSVIIGKMDKKCTYCGAQKFKNETPGAPGSTGKTFLISIILATIRSQNNIALAIASAGIATTLLDGGLLAHSAL